MIKSIGLLVLAALVVAACAAPATPVKQFTKGEELAFYDFSEGGTFEEGSYADGAVRLQIRDGVYRLTLSEGDSEIWYGQWGDSQRDVVIDVEAKQTSEGENTVYGVACRLRGAVGQRAGLDAELAAAAEATAEATTEALEATSEATAEATAEAASEATAEATGEVTAEATAEATTEVTATASPEATAETTPELEAGGATILNPNNGDGYLFLVEGTGRFAIMRARGRNVTALVDWTSSDAIRKAPAQNSIRAVCMGNYLALYVNGQFMADATDDTYNEGQVGLVGASASRLGLTVDFDNLTVSEASSS